MKKLISLLIAILFFQNNFAQDLTTKDSLVNYFGDHHNNLDPIEGLWVLNVETTLYHNDSIIRNQTEEFRSEWAVVKKNSIQFEVLNIGGAETEENATNFDAYFERTAVKGLYTYECHFKDPNWVGRSTVRITDKVFLEYGYYCSDAYMKKTYNGKYGKDYRQYWRFTWIKKYPVEEQIVGDYLSDWKGGGSGFFIDKRGYIATNYHVIVDAKKIEVEFKKNDKLYKFNAEVVKTDKENDLAILKIKDNKSLPFYSLPYQIKTSYVGIGTQVFALGYPLTEMLGNEIKLTNGMISSGTGYKGDPSTYQTTTPIQPGNSGGPLFDFDGNIIGINSSHIKPEYADNVSYSIKTQYLQKLANKIPDNVSLQNQNRLQSKSLIEKINTVKDYVVLIRVK